jgi:hypothetical protein
MFYNVMRTVCFSLSEGGSHECFVELSKVGKCRDRRAKCAGRSTSCTENIGNTRDVIAKRERLFWGTRGETLAFVTKRNEHR